METSIIMAPVSRIRSNWNLEVLVFVEGRKPENPKKNPQSKVRTNIKPGENQHRTRVTEVGGERLSIVITAACYSHLQLAIFFL